MTAIAANSFQESGLDGMLANVTNANKSAATPTKNKTPAMIRAALIAVSIGCVSIGMACLSLLRRIRRIQMMLIRPLGPAAIARSLA